MTTRQPTQHDRCADCGAPIDPRNYGATRYGFACLPCDDARIDYMTTAHDEETAS